MATFSAAPSTHWRYSAAMAGSSVISRLLASLASATAMSTSFSCELTCFSRMRFCIQSRVARISAISALRSTACGSGRMERISSLFGYRRMPSSRALLLVNISLPVPKSPLLPANAMAEPMVWGREASSCCCSGVRARAMAASFLLVTSVWGCTRKSWQNTLQHASFVRAVNVPGWPARGWPVAVHSCHIHLAVRREVCKVFCQDLQVRFHCRQIAEVAV